MTGSPITSALPAAGGAFLGAGMGASIGAGSGSVAAGLLSAGGLSVLWAVIFDQAARRRRNGND